MSRVANNLLLCAALACVGACAAPVNRTVTPGHGGANGGAAGDSAGLGGAGTGGSAGRQSDVDGGGRDTAAADTTGVGRRGDAASSAGGNGAAASDGGPALHSDAREADTGRSACPGLFCEDFERGVIDPAVWDIKVNGGQAPPNVVMQAGLVGHGKYAAHFRAAPNVVSYDFMITKNPPAALSGHHFGRAYFMITPMPPTNHTEYIYAGTTGFPQYKYLEVASAAPLVWQLTFVNLVPPGTGEDYHSGGTVPIGKWFCLEWEFNDSPDQASVFVDGAASFSQGTFTFNGSTTGLVGGFAAFGFGYYAWHPATYAFDVYYDDIVLDTQRVGCLD